MVRIALFSLLAIGVQSQNTTRRYPRGLVRTPNAHTLMKDHTPVATYTDEERANVPDKLDWSEKGATTSIKDQHKCGACWAYSAVASVESAVFMSSGRLPEPLSVQQVVSCDREDDGCDGGDILPAFKYLKEEGGIDTESHYPDKSRENGKNGHCENFEHAVKVTDYKLAIPMCDGGSCTHQNEDDLKVALHKHGPISVCVNANDGWDDYTHGVYKEKCSGKFSAGDHVVQLVGYDTTAPTPYWKIRNSWGSDWGLNGHILLPMGENACGLADEAAFVTAEFSSGPAPTPTPAPSPDHHHRRRRHHHHHGDAEVDNEIMV